MDTTTISLVLISAALHAWWNLLLKRAGGSQIVVAYSKIAESVIFAPAFLVIGIRGLPPLGTTTFTVLVTASGVLLTYFALASAYHRGDLSFVYPIARGSSLAFLPALGALFLHERISATSAAALGVIVCGIVVLQLRSFSRDAWAECVASFKSAATRFALLAGFVTSVFVIWDKRAVRSFPPFSYLYLYTSLVALAYAAWLFRNADPVARREEWKAHRGAAVGIGILNTASYLLTLIALQGGVSSIVIGLRQISIAFGAWLGWVVLREKVTVPRVIGTTLIVLGCGALGMTSR